MNVLSAAVYITSTLKNSCLKAPTLAQMLRSGSQTCDLGLSLDRMANGLE